MNTHTQSISNDSDAGCRRGRYYCYLHTRTITRNTCRFVSDILSASHHTSLRTTDQRHIEIGTHGDNGMEWREGAASAAVAVDEAREAETGTVTATFSSDTQTRRGTGDDCV